jgi:RNA polymerase sigma-70 factor (ECF subfamily)
MAILPPKNKPSDRPPVYNLKDGGSSIYEDQELVKRTLKGDKGAFEMIIHRYQQPVLNYIGRMVGERQLALDISQDIFIKVYASLHSYRPQFKFSTWMYKIASNYMIDHWRRKKIPVVSIDQPVRDDEDCLKLQVPDSEPSVARKFELKEIRGKIEAALETLPVGLRELFVLRHINGLSYEEVAAIKGLPLGTVKNRVFQAKEMLKTLLEEQP